MGTFVTSTSARDLFNDICERPPSRVSEASAAFREKVETTRIPINAEQGNKECTAIEHPAEFKVRCALNHRNALLSVLLGLEKKVACQDAFCTSPWRLINLCRATREHKTVTVVFPPKIRGAQTRT